MEVQHFFGFPCVVFLLVFVSLVMRVPIARNEARDSLDYHRKTRGCPYTIKCMYLRGVVREMQQQNNNYASCTVHLRARKASKTHAKHPQFFCVTALFTNMQTLKFKSHLRNCVFRCGRS